MRKRNKAIRPQNAALWWALADQGVWLVMLSFCTWLALHELDTAYRALGLAAAGGCAVAILLRCLYLGYRFYRVRGEVAIANPNPAYNKPPRSGTHCPVCGRRLLAATCRKSTVSRVCCPGPRCGYEWSA